MEKEFRILVFSIVKTIQSGKIDGFKASEYLANLTPIRDKETNEFLSIGDYVESERGHVGTLAWEECFNEFIIKTESGGNVHARTYKKIEKLRDNNFDTTTVECRKNHLKKKW